MKYLAHLKKDGSDEPITIYHIIHSQSKRDHNDYRKYEQGKEYYSLWRFEPMKAIVNGNKRPHFAYKNSNAKGNGGLGESIEHELSKHVISKLSVLKLSAYKKSYELLILNAKLENPLNYEGRNYRVDVMLEIEDCDFSRYIGTRKIAIEVKKGNAVKKEKRSSIRNIEEGIALVQLTLFDQIKANFPDEIEQLYKRLEGYWRIEQYAEMLCFPLQSQRWAENVEKIKKQKDEDAISKRREIEGIWKKNQEEFQKKELERKRLLESQVTESQKHVAEKSNSIPKSTSLYIVIASVVLLLVIVFMIKNG